MPSELWTAWNLDPVIWGVLAGAALVYGWAVVVRPLSEWWRPRCFATGLGVAAVALVSPLDALSGSLGSAHMVQH
ncbi:MAG: cytochrome c oxidase assembly protein, partial [Ilumatobacteraceae bacterium]